jgi:sulfur carrier protein
MCPQVLRNKQARAIVVPQQSVARGEFYCNSMLSQNVKTFMITLHINGKQREFEQENMTVANLIQMLGLEGKRLAIECNGEIVPRGSFAETALHSSDKLEIVGAVGGG